MSTFAVTREIIGSVRSIQGADRIELAQLKGMDFQFVVPKGKFKVGDTCIYFPLDSIIPDSLLKRLGLHGKLGGKKKNRVTTIRLRGEISQGIVADASLADGVPDDKLTEFFGVVKYEPPEPLSEDCIRRPLPVEVPFYDIEAADRHPDIVNLLMEEEVVVTEKVEGSNLSVLAVPGGRIAVCSHRCEIIEKPGVPHTWWATAERCGVIEFARRLAKQYNNAVVIYGELIGPHIRSNIYSRSSFTIEIFDILVGNNWLGYSDFVDAFQNHTEDLGVSVVPILHVGKFSSWLSGKTVKQASTGKSKLWDVEREGIVVKPVCTRVIEKFGRLILKQHNPEYLLRGV